MGCATEEASECSDLDLGCTRKASATLSNSFDSPVAVGQQVILDASESIFDESRWYLSDHEVHDCRDQSECVVTFEAPGIYDLRVAMKARDSSPLGFVGAEGDKSEDEITATIVVEDVCLPGADFRGEGIAVKRVDGQCLVMEKEDRAQCRYPDYSGCQPFEVAKTLCDAGIIPGPHWYLPSMMELFDMLENAIPENGLCNNNSMGCLADELNIPSFYWSRDLDTSEARQRSVDSVTAEEFLVPMEETLALSVRCVKQLGI